MTEESKADHWPPNRRHWMLLVLCVVVAVSALTSLNSRIGSQSKKEADTTNIGRGLGPRIKPADLLANRSYAESDIDFARRIKELVHSRTYHCDVTVPARYWLLRAVGAMVPEYRRVYIDYGMLASEYLDCGLCHQAAFVAADFLDQGGVANVKVWGLNGHVIAKFVSNGQEYVLDPDYGVGPFKVDWSAPERLLEQVTKAYSTVADAKVREMLVGIYTNVLDDKEYVSLLGLRSIADEQRRIIAFQYAIEVLGASLVVLVAMRLFRGNSSPLHTQKF